MSDNREPLGFRTWHKLLGLWFKQAGYCYISPFRLAREYYQSTPQKVVGGGGEGRGGGLYIIM